MISVIIPTYNRSLNLKRAVESVLNCEGECQVVVVDDNGIGTECQIENENVLHDFILNNRILYIKHQTNLNGAAARNTGLHYASGEFVTFLDDDDEFLPGRISQIEKIIKKANPDLLYTDVVVKNKGKFELVTKYRKMSKEEYQRILLSCESFFGTGSNMVCRKSIVDSIGGFDSTYARQQDLEFMLRFLDASNSVFVIKQPLVIKNNDDRQNAPDIEKFEKIREKYLNDFDYIVKRYSDIDQAFFRKKVYTYLLLQSMLIKNRRLISKYRQILINMNAYSSTEMQRKVIKNKIRNLKATILIRHLVYKIVYMKRLDINYGRENNA